MAESSLVLVLLGLMAGCLMVLTGVVVVTARDLRQTLQRINQTLDEGHAFLARVNTIAQCVVGVFEPLMFLKRQVESLFIERIGNGAGAEPRRHHRRG